MKSSMYLKYKQERKNARLLKDAKNHNWQLNEVRQAAKPANQSLRVSLPIQYFIDMQNQRHTLINDLMLRKSMNNANKQLQYREKIPKLILTRLNASADDKINTEKLRQVRPNRTNKAVNNVSVTNLNKNTHESHSPISNEEDNKMATSVFFRNPTCYAIKNVALKESTEKKKIISKTDTLKGNCHEAKSCESQEFIKHMLPVPVIPVKNINGISFRLINSLAEAKKIMKISEESKFTQTEEVKITTTNELEILEKVQKSGMMVKDLSEALDKYLKRKEKNKAVVTEIIDLEAIDCKSTIVDGDQIKVDKVKMALNQSQSNKKFMNTVLAQIKNAIANKVIDVSRPSRADTPFPFDNCAFDSAPYPSRADEDSKTQAHDETGNKIRKVSEANDQLNELNMNTLTDTAQSQGSFHHPPVVTALMRDYQLQRHQLTPKQITKLQKLQSQQQMLPPPQLPPPQFPPPQLLLPQVPPSPLLPVQLQTSQESHSQQSQRQFPTLQPPQYLLPQFAHQLQRQKQHEQQMHQQMFYRQQQQRTWSQQNVQYTLTRNNYPNIYGQQVNSTKIAQEGEFQLHPGDPRRLSRSRAPSRITPGPARTMTSYEANFQRAQNNTRPDNNWAYQHYWNNSNHYW